VLLRVESLSVRLHSKGRRARQRGGHAILSDVSLSVHRGEIIGVIGETGSGKTTLARCVMGLVKPVTGSVHFDGREISRLRPKQLRAFRREGHLQFVFQDPLRSLDPDMTVRDIIQEGLMVQGTVAAGQQAEDTEVALQTVGLDAGILGRRPSQISGGQRQRVAIARALVMRPRMLLCDEPVSALDASTRNYVLGILGKLRDDLGLALVVISHDLVSLSGVADRIAVLYNGRVVEEGPTDALFSSPRHPYTALLLASAPKAARGRDAALVPLDRFPRSPDRAAADASRGCAFAPRCPFATQVCSDEIPEMTKSLDKWSVACHHADEWPASTALRASSHR
jgi:oligopeptide/dipeptide ABC transporter ATP-binding protein